MVSGILALYLRLLIIAAGKVKDAYFFEKQIA
jgi:hypothetical protein